MRTRAKILDSKDYRNLVRAITGELTVRDLRGRYDEYITTDAVTITELTLCVSKCHFVKGK